MVNVYLIVIAEMALGCILLDIAAFGIMALLRRVRP